MYNTVFGGYHPVSMQIGYQNNEAVTSIFVRGAIYGSPHPEENARASPGLSSLGLATAPGFPHAG